MQNNMEKRCECCVYCDMCTEQAVRQQPICPWYESVDPDDREHSQSDRWTEMSYNRFPGLQKTPSMRRRLRNGE